MVLIALNAYIRKEMLKINNQNLDRSQEAGKRQPKTKKRDEGRAEINEM